MTRNETKHMESALALSETLHFSRAAKKLGMSQPMLTKNIQDLEEILGGRIFDRNRKTVRLNEAGRAYIEQARLSLLYGERAFQAARAVMQDNGAILNVGRSPYSDPFLTSLLHSIQLPLTPKFKIELTSGFSCDLVDDILAGVLDVVLATEPLASPLLTALKVSESPFYIAMSRQDNLADHPEVTLTALSQRCWMMPERRLHPPLYDLVMSIAERKQSIPKQIRHMTGPEEAFPFVANGTCIALVAKSGALLLARNGVTVRPLAEPELLLKTYLVSRADNESKLLSEFVRSFMTKLSKIRGETTLAPSMGGRKQPESVRARHQPSLSRSSMI